MAAALVIGVALFGVTGAGASTPVSTKTLRPDVNGKANALTLRIRLQVAPELALGIPNPLGAQDIEQVISTTGATVHRKGEVGWKTERTVSRDGPWTITETVRNPRIARLTGAASGFATVGAGLVDLGSATSACPGAGCGILQSVDGIEIELPGNLGVVRALGATSRTTSIIDTRNATELVRVQLNPLAEGPLAQVGELLQEALVVPVNENLVPVADEVLQGVKESITDPIMESLPQEIQDAVEIGHVTPLPNIASTNLLSLVLKRAVSDIHPTTVADRTGKARPAMTAVAESEIADLSVLGGYVNLGSARLSAISTASVFRGGASARAVSDIVDLNVGELLGVHITPETLDFLANRLDDVVDQIQPLAELAEIIEQVAGVKIERFGTSEFASPDGLRANAKAGTLRITVEPKVPDPASLADALVAGLDSSKVKYSSAGVKLTVELPSAESAIGLGPLPIGDNDVRRARTGLGTGGYALAGVLMIGAAIGVRRFALR